MSSNNPMTLHEALAEIAKEAVAKDSILQAGVAFALGTLAEAADCQPGWTTDDVADALLRGSND
jgi:hypothetical protein